MIVDKRLGAKGLNVHNEAEYVIANHLPDKYITNLYHVNSKKFSPELEAALNILEEYEPGFVALLRDGVLPVRTDIPSPFDGKAGGSMGPQGLNIYTDPHYPVTTAYVVYEEIVHAFQGRMTGWESELKAHTAAAEFIKKNNLLDKMRTEMKSTEVWHYIAGNQEDFENIIYDNYSSLRIQVGDSEVSYLDYVFPPGILYGRDIQQFLLEK